MLSKYCKEIADEYDIKDGDVNGDVRFVNKKKDFFEIHKQINLCYS